jgi:hypothetical protein
MNFHSKVTRSIQAMGAVKGSKGKHFLLRMPMDLYKEARAMADRRRWSVTKYIVHCVASTVKREKHEDVSDKGLASRFGRVAWGKWFRPTS